MLRHLVHGVSNFLSSLKHNWKRGFADNTRLPNDVEQAMATFAGGVIHAGFLDGRASVVCLPSGGGPRQQDSTVRGFTLKAAEAEDLERFRSVRVET